MAKVYVAKKEIYVNGRRKAKFI